MMIWFKCKEEDLMIGLETDIKPAIGDTIRIKEKDYTVDEVVWCLEEPPRIWMTINISAKNPD
jgi:hypothetical protein